MKTIPIVIKAEKLVINLKGKSIDLTIEEAKTLQKELENALGISNRGYYYRPVYIDRYIYQNPWQQYNSPSYPWNTPYCGSISGISSMQSQCGNSINTGLGLSSYNSGSNSIGAIGGLLNNETHSLQLANRI